MLKKIFTDEEEFWTDRDMILQKNVENNLGGACEQ